MRHQRQIVHAELTRFRAEGFVVAADVHDIRRRHSRAHDDAGVFQPAEFHIVGADAHDLRRFDPGERSFPQRFDQSLLRSRIAGQIPRLVYENEVLIGGKAIRFSIIDEMAELLQNLRMLGRQHAQRNRAPVSQRQKPVVVFNHAVPAERERID